MGSRHRRAGVRSRRRPPLQGGRRPRSRSSPRGTGGCSNADPAPLDRRDAVTIGGRTRACPGRYRSGVARSQVRGFQGAAVVALVAFVVAACGSGNTTPANVTPDPQTVTSLDGRFELRFTVARTTLRPGDNIGGTAELHLRAGGSGALSGSSSLFGFEFVEVGGQNRVVAPAFPTDCSPHQVGSEHPPHTRSSSRAELVAEARTTPSSGSSRGSRDPPAGRHLGHHGGGRVHRRSVVLRAPAPDPGDRPRAVNE